MSERSVEKWAWALKSDKFSFLNSGIIIYKLSNYGKLNYFEPQFLQLLNKVILFMSMFGVLTRCLKGILKLPSPFCRI